MVKWKNHFVIAAMMVAVIRLPNVARADFKPFFDQYCFQCHGAEKPKANLSLHNLSPNPVTRAEIDTWKRVLDKIELGEMPPDGSKNPIPDERQKIVASIKGMLNKAGEILDKAPWLAPSRGNYIDHDTLFSGKPLDPALTRPRLWRLTGQAYEQFMQQKNKQFGLGLAKSGNDKIRSPWELGNQKEFSDYASAHRIGDADIEYHLRNATQLANAMVRKFSGPRTLSLSGWIPEVSVVLKAGQASTPDQIEVAVTGSFDKILNRSLETADVERYATFFRKNLETLDAEKATEQFLIAILLRPEVMYRLELPSTPGERSMMAPPFMARAISLALTDDEPDGALMKASRGGRLLTRDEVREHVERILADRTIAKPRILRFFQEYFGYTKAPEVFKDDVALAEHGLKRFLYAPDFFVGDTDRLVQWVLDRDKQVLRELLTTRKTFVMAGYPKITQRERDYLEKLNQVDGKKKAESKKEATQAVYEIAFAIKDWTDEEPFDMPAEHRMGILTHPSWLIAHTTNFDNHAIHRGKWIREKLLGGRVPDVPITVEAVLPDEPHQPLRDRMRVTRDDYCWKCHQLMDPLGLPFQQYDHFGRFRTEEMVVDKEATESKRIQGKLAGRVTKKVPLDTSGLISQSGDANLEGPLKDPQEMILKLATSERVEQVFVRHAFRYFLGRNETLSDGPSLIAAHRAYKESDGSMQALITALLTSDSFLYRGK